MSLFSWLFPKPRPGRARTQAPPASRAAERAGGNAPHPVPRPAAAAAADAEVMRKNERAQRREQLYAVVRDVMVRMGVLSAGYKFKVLSLDQRGAQFLIMVDMAPEYGGDAVRGAEIESLIVQTAQTRCDILVTSVYWRINAQLGVQPARPGAQPGSTAVPRSASARPPMLSSRPAPLMPPVQPAQPAPRFEPIEPDEVAAFKQALATAAAARPPVSASAPLSGTPTRSGPLLPPSTDFEDTLMPTQRDNSKSADLSNTQYGDLR